MVVTLTGLGESEQGSTGPGRSTVESSGRLCGKRKGGSRSCGTRGETSKVRGNSSGSGEGIHLQGSRRGGNREKD